MSIPITPADKLILCIRLSNFSKAIKLIESGVDINMPDDDGTTILMAAATSTQYDIVDKLIKLGANIHATDDSAETALHHAARFRRANTIKLLIRHGAKVNDFNIDNRTPLHIALKRLPYDFDSIVAMVSNGSRSYSPTANCNMKHEFGEPPLETAIKSRIDEYTIEYLNDYVNQQKYDCVEQYLENVFDTKIIVIKYLLDNGVQYDDIDENRLILEYADIIKMIREYITLPTKGVF